MAPRITVTVDYELGDELPTGDGYVRYQDLYVTGDTFQKAIERVPTGKVITFPAETFEIDTPGWNIGDNAALWVPQYCGGFWGSGKGALGQTDQGTVFRVKENTAAGSVPGGWFKAEGVTVPLTLRNFHVQGTEQGYQVDAQQPAQGWNGTDRKLFTNLFIYNPRQFVHCADILSTGWHGNNGAPPGETFGFQLYGAPDFLTERIECDGRREVGGPSYGAAGFTIGNALAGTVKETYAHHVMESGFPIWQAANIQTFDCVVGDPAEKDSAPTIYGYNKSWLNHERTTNITHTNIALNVWYHGRTTEHVSHSNDGGSYTNRAGQSVNFSNGTIRLINPTWSNIVHGRPSVATWIPYGSGNTMTSSNRPQIFQSNGTTPIPFDWNFGGTWQTNITTS